MSNKELVELQTTLSVLDLEMKNLMEHLQLQVSNYTSVLEQLIKLTDECWSEKSHKISELEFENAKLKAALTGSDESDVYKCE
ncbi:MAG: hypothetical protein ABW185_24240 [Sedimenticola sp.]